MPTENSKERTKQRNVRVEKKQWERKGEQVERVSDTEHGRGKEGCS